MKMKHIFLLVTSVLLVAMLLVSCAPKTPETSAPTATTAPPATTTTAPATTAPAAKPVYGGTLTLIATMDITGFDLTSSPTNGATIPLTNGTLIGGDWAKGPAGTNEFSWTNSGYYGMASLRGNLAESWEIPEVGTVIFRIRKGVRFALDPNNEASRLMNGREFTADDVVFNFRRATTVPTAFARVSQPAISATANFTAPDKYTVIMKTPVDPWTAFLLFGCGIGTRQMAPEVIQRYGNQLDWRNSVGTGPFILTDFVPGGQATLKRNPNYWDKDSVGPGKGNQLPYVDVLKILIITDTSTQLAAIRTGKADVSPALTFDDARSLMKTNPEMGYGQSIVDGATIIGLRTDKPDLPYKDKRVRQALMMGFDFEMFKEQMYAGYAETLVWPVSPIHGPDLIDTLDKMPPSVRALYTYNPEGAKKLLAEAGYPNGFKAGLICPNSTAAIDAMSVVKEMWAKIGVIVEIQPRETAVYSSISSAKAYPEMAYVMALGSAVYANMVNFRGPSVFNRSYWNDPPGKDPVVEAAYAEVQKYLFLDDAKTRRLYRELMPYILEQAPVITVPSPYTYVFWHPWVKNYHGERFLDYQMGNVWAAWVWLDQRLKESMTGRK